LQDRRRSPAGLQRVNRNFLCNKRVYCCLLPCYHTLYAGFGLHFFQRLVLDQGCIRTFFRVTTCPCAHCACKNACTQYVHVCVYIHMHTSCIYRYMTYSMYMHRKCIYIYMYRTNMRSISDKQTFQTVCGLCDRLYIHASLVTMDLESCLIHHTTDLSML
jgi:hypothetical protein